MLVTLGSVGGVSAFRDRNASPLTGRVVGNTRQIGKRGWQYRPEIEYTDPKTGKRGVISPRVFQSDRWEVGSSVELAFDQTRGKARYRNKFGWWGSAVTFIVGATLSVSAFM